MPKTRSSIVDRTRRRFADAVAAVGGSDEAAFALGVSRAFVDLIIEGRRNPGMVTARGISAIFGIPMEDWVECPRIESRTRVVR